MIAPLLETTPASSFYSNDYRTALERETLGLLSLLHRTAFGPIHHIGFYERKPLDEQFFEALLGVAPAVLIRTGDMQGGSATGPFHASVSLEVFAAVNGHHSQEDRMHADQSSVDGDIGMNALLAAIRGLLLGRKLVACSKPLYIQSESPVERGDYALTVWRQQWVAPVVMEPTKLPLAPTGPVDEWQSYEINNLIFVEPTK